MRQLFQWDVEYASFFIGKMAKSWRKRCHIIKNVFIEKSNFSRPNPLTWVNFLVKWLVCEL